MGRRRVAAARDGGARSLCRGVHTKGSYISTACRLIGGQATSRTYQEHVVHVYDSGGVESQRLVERARALPRVKQRSYDAGTRCGPGGLGDAQGTGGAYVEHVAHACEAGGVEVQRLVERRRVLPSQEKRAYDARGEVRAVEGGRRRATAAHQAAHRGGLGCRLGQAMRAERTLNMEDIVVTLAVSKLRSWLNALAYCRAEMRARSCEVGGGAAGRQTGGGGRRRGASCVRGGLDCRLETGHACGAYVEHVAHVCDAGRVESQRLVERPCVLPSRKEGMRLATRCAGGPGDERAADVGGARSVQACVQGRARLQIGGQGTWEERTQNIQLMPVTLDVSNFSGWLNALAPCRESNKSHTMRDEVRAGSGKVAGDGNAKFVEGSVPGT